MTHLVNWCQENTLPEDVIKTKDLILQEEAKNKIKIKITPRLLMERADFITLTHHEELSLSASLPFQLPGGPQTAPTRTIQTLCCHQGGVGYLKAKTENMRSFFPKAMWVLNE